MSDPTENKPPSQTPEPAYVDQTSPDALMSDFRGKPIVTIVVFTLIVHAVFIGVFSLGYLKDRVLGEDTSSLSEEDRMDVAVREGTSALRKIADRHNVSVQDLSARFAGGPKPAPAVEPPAGDTGDQPPADADPASDEPGSEIERVITESEDGPDLPPLTDDIDEEDPIFPE